MKDWLTKSAADQGRAIATGDIGPVALTEAYLEAAATHETAPRIYARMTPERALAEAEAAEARAKSGQRLSPLDGVPISWKDLFDTAGVVTEAGSALLEGRRPDRDAEVLARATRMGLICLGKTHMSELAFSGLGLNPVTETTPCVDDPEAVSGGSSSGAAGSVAFGLAAAGIGSDTGGSVRIPAAWNDLVGLKTTAGKLPLTGVVPLCARFDTIGPLTRTVEDAALIHAILSCESAVDLAGATLRGRRFVVPTTIAMEDLREVPTRAFETARAAIEAAGAEVEFAEMPFLTEAFTLTAPLYTGEAYGTWGAVIEAAPDKMFPEILARFRAGRDVSSEVFVSAWQKLEEYRAAFDAAIAPYDAALMPASPILPPNLHRLMTDSDYYVRENLLSLRNTRIGNLMGSASLTVPAGAASCGAMLVAAPGSERRLLRLGRGIERALA